MQIIHFPKYERKNWHVHCIIKVEVHSTVFPHYPWGLRSFPFREYENPRIIEAVSKRLCMISYALKYASQTHSRDSLTHLYSNNVVMINQKQ